MVTMKTPILLRSATLILALALAACGTSTAASAPRPPSTVRAAFMHDMEMSAEAWNQGDLDGFLATYLPSEETTFVGRNGLIRGKDAIRETYRQSYWRDGGPPRGLLSFRDMEVRPLGEEHALATGRYVLTDRATGAQSATGIFTLVLRRTTDGWRIIHDQSS